jgi:hypothetical protein
MEKPGIENPNTAWGSLCIIGGAAALIAAILFRRNLAAEYLLLRGMGIISSGPTALPVTVADWFALLQKNRFLGLTLLNLFDIVNYALVGLIFLGLFAALRRVNPGTMTLALALAVAGAAVYFASNQAFPMLYLSDQYAAAATETQRAAALSAGQALLAIQNTAANYGYGIYVGYFLVNVAGLIAAAVMLRGPVFGKAAAWFGILANGIGLGYYVALAVDPSLTIIPVPASAPFLLVWYILVGVRLLRLGRMENRTLAE